MMSYNFSFEEHVSFLPLTYVEKETLILKHQNELDKVKEELRSQEEIAKEYDLMEEALGNATNTLDIIQDLLKEKGSKLALVMKIKAAIEDNIIQ